jgi:RimJ/RimL family protein N-acetyltransferase
MAYSISLLPLDPEYHTAALQAVYDATPAYWGMYGLPSAPQGQAAADLQAANETPGRFLLGIVRRVDERDAAAGAEMIGLVDLRLHWPEEAVAYIGMLMVAEPLQRQGIGSQAWSLLAPWLAASAKVQTVRLGIEQFNIGALKFWEHMGFALTGESDRIRSGEQFVRLLYLQKTLPDTK